MAFRIENVVPVLNVEDLSRSISFYCDVLGFKNADWGDEWFTAVARDNSCIYLCKGSQGHRGTWIWLGFEGDIRELHETLKSAGVKIKMPPTNFRWAYEMHIEDPDGHILRLGTEPDESQPINASGFSGKDY